MIVPRPRWRRLVGPAITLIVLVIGGIVGADSLPDWSSLADALSRATPLLVGAAIAAETVGVVALSGLQVVMIRSFGGVLTLRRSLAITYGSTAVAGALPAGGPLSIAYSIRLLGRSGVTAAQATAASLVAGVLNVLTLAVLFAALTVGVWTSWILGHCLLVSTIGGVIGLSRLVSRGTATSASLPPTPQPVGPVGRVLSGVQDVGRSARSLPGSVLAQGMALGLVKWSLNLVSLWWCCAAVGLELGVVAVATAHLTTQVARQFSVTPGAVGVVEVVLAAALVAVGAPVAAAAAAVLLYRVASHWLPVALGGVAAARLHLRGGATPAAGDTRLPQLQ